MDAPVADKTQQQQRTEEQRAYLKKTGTWTVHDFENANRMLESLLTHTGMVSRLRKQGYKTKNWKRRWFSLGIDMSGEARFYPVKLYYRENKDDRRHINFVVIGPGTIVREDPTEKCVFLVGESTVELDGGRVYRLMADSEDECISWVVVLRNIVKILVQRTVQPAVAEAIGEENAKLAEGAAKPSASNKNSNNNNSNNNNNCLGSSKEELLSVDEVLSAAPVKKPSKADRLLDRFSMIKKSSAQDKPLVRPSLDLMVDRATNLPAFCAGKKVSIRAVFYNPCTSGFQDWEYSPTHAASVSATGEVEWHIDFSYEMSIIGSELILRVTLDKTNEIVGEVRLEPYNMGGGKINWSMPLVVPLTPPVWDAKEVEHAGGTLLAQDVEKQGGKRDLSESRGVLYLTACVNEDSASGMLAKLGSIGDPFPVRLNTGDVLLFNQSTSAARITKLFTWSNWSHAAMVFRRRNGFLAVLEATGDGVGVYDIDNVWWRYHKIADIGLCRLMVPGGITEQDHERLYAFIESVKGRPYERSLVSLLQKVTQGNTVEKGSSDSAASSVRRRNKSRTDGELTEVFCSQLVAAAFRSIGILAPDSALELLPKHFDVHEAGPLQWERDAKLFPPRIFPKGE